jgi:hypothetical protein
VTQQQRDALLRAAILAASAFVPVTGVAAEVAVFVAALVQVAQRAGHISDAEAQQLIADAQAEGEIEDALYDAFIARLKAKRGTET